jgi:hypothetical protein
VPTLRDGTLVRPADVGFPAIPGVQVARFGNSIYPFGDWVDPVPQRGKTYATLVSKVDADGNEVAGIRLPDIAVPVASYTGWNLYKAPFPEGELCDRDGSYSAFPTTPSERAKVNDPRPSIAERYASPEDYVGRVAAVAQSLVADRLLLAEDAARYVSAAVQKNPVPAR